MAKYVCQICGYVYDEAAGIPEQGIPPGTKWEDLPDDWICPLCGAAKAEFKKREESPASAIKTSAPNRLPSGDMKEMTALEISALCTNLSRGCEKQYKEEEATLFRDLAFFFKTAAAPPESPSSEQLLRLIDKDLVEGFPNANAISSDSEDRGALRALVWSEKVTRILKSLLIRYEKEGDTMLEKTGVYVCTICGFVYVGDTLPQVCPVCKAPNWKFERIEGSV